MAGHYSLHENAIEILSRLAATSIMVLNEERSVPSSSSLVGTGSYSTPTRLDNLKAICGCIQDSELTGMDLNLEYSINLIQFRIKLEVLVRETGKRTLNNLVKDLVKDSDCGCSESQLKRWLGWGSKLADFCGSGEFFFVYFHISPSLRKE